MRIIGIVIPMENDDFLYSCNFINSYPLAIFVYPQIIIHIRVPKLFLFLQTFFLIKTLFFKLS